jgi:hypothetical protein
VQSSVRTLGTFVVIALVLVVGVVGLSLCADALGEECEHLYCRSASHVAPLERIVRKAWAVFALSATLALPVFALASQRTRTAFATLASSLAPSGAAPLRI